MGGAHALGVVDGEGHGAFLIDVFAGGEGVDEMLAVQVLGRGDENGVDGLVVQQPAVIEMEWRRSGETACASSRRRV